MINLHQNTPKTIKYNHLWNHAMAHLKFGKLSASRPSYNNTVNLKSGSTNIGAYKLDHPDEDKNQAVYERLTDEEIVQSKEFRASYSKMRRSMGTKLEDFTPYPVYADPKFIEMAYECALRLNHEKDKLLPMHEMLTGLFNALVKANSTGKLNDIFEKYHFNSNINSFLVNIPVSTRSDIIKTALYVSEDTEHVLRTFVDIALDRYNTELNLHFLQRVIDDSNNVRIQSNWVSCAIDVIQAFGSNAFECCDPVTVFYYWLLPRTKILASTDALKKFKLVFDLSDDDIEPYIDTFNRTIIDLYTAPIGHNHIYAVKV
jgi:hypothetical protein